MHADAHTPRYTQIHADSQIHIHRLVDSDTNRHTYAQTHTRTQRERERERERE